MMQYAGAQERVLLQLNEAVPLASALVGFVARLNGMRALIIKGSTLEAYGLRPPRLSTDVDVLVDPSCIEDLAALLSDQGWARRESRFPGQWDAPHSLTLVNDEWPCDIDLHRFFPGFLADPEVVFDELWARRQVLAVAHSECDIPDEPTSALIMALNEGRARGKDKTHTVSRSWVISRTPEQQKDFRELVFSTGSELTFGAACGLELFIPDANPPSQDEFRARLLRAMTGDHGTYFWQVAFRHATIRDRVRGLTSLALQPPDRTKEGKRARAPLTTRKLRRLYRSARRRRLD